MNKLGKLPKERLCMQDTGLSDIQLTEMLRHCVTFLDMFLDVSRHIYLSTIGLLLIEAINIVIKLSLQAELLAPQRNCSVKFEELWENHETGPQAFATLAISQTPAWYDLILLHLQLANVLHMMAHFNMKFSKPMVNLFESVVSD